MSTDPLQFMMGNFTARIPQNLLYCRNHLWLSRADDSSVYRIGLTAYSVRLLQDVYFLEWSIDPDSNVREKQEIGQIESSKALSSLYPPGPGRLIKFNDQLLDDPSAINTDNYGAGWLYEFDAEENWMNAEQYRDHLAENWDRTQQMIKGQVNEDS